MAIKVYMKRGNTNYREKKYIAKLEKAIQEKLEKDPNFKFEPAKSFDELEALYNAHVPEDVEFEEQGTSTEGTNEQTTHTDANTEGTKTTMETTEKPVPKKTTVKKK